MDIHLMQGTVVPGGIGFHIFGKVLCLLFVKGLVVKIPGKA